MKHVVLLLAIYAVAMALLEAAVVVYMRRLYYPEDPSELFPLTFLNVYDPRLELAREAATILMIVSVALLAERRSLTRCFAAFVFVFGTWDLFYYVWLKVLIHWPRSWLEWDVLFLIPFIWLGPWVCPAAIATLFVVWGAWILLVQREARFTVKSLAMFVAGVALCLASFLQPAIGNQGQSLANYMPGTFWWWLFLPGYLLMAGSLVVVAAPLRRRSLQPV